jgi:hypothetical protein
LLNATFAFTKQEFKPIFKAMLILVLPLLVLLGIISGIFQAEFLSMKVAPEDFGSGGMEYIQTIIIQYGLMMLVYYLATSVISAVVLGYIIEYINNGPQVPFENIVAQVKTYLPRLMWLNIVYIVIITIAMFFFLIPGIYLYIALAISPVILVFEDATIGTSFKRSMYFLKGFWWRTVGYVIIIGLIYSLISSVFSIPTFILTVLQTTGIIPGSPDSPTMLMLSILANIISTFSYLFLSFVIIFLSLYYFSQYEIKEAGNIIKSVDELGAK